jgi:excisionase family DNA binding protein
MQRRHPEILDATGKSVDGWLNLGGAARYLNREERFVRRLVQERRIRFYKHGRFLAFRKSDLDTWAFSECHEPRD